MPWNEVDVQEQRMRFVMRAVGKKERMSALCREFGISRPTGYRWLRRYQGTRRLCALQEKSRRPQRSPRKTGQEKEQRVVALRQETGWGAKKLHVLLAEEQILLPVRTIHRILERCGMIGEAPHGAALERFERSAPNQLWQMDSKGKYPLADGACHPLTILDDHSRFVVGLYALPLLTAERAYAGLLHTFRRYGVPEAMLMDRGSLWWATANGWGLTWLSVHLIEQGIRLIYGRVAHPQTQGKVERFHRTLGAELRHRGVPQRFAQWPAALAEVEFNYNHRRPHEALGMQRPVERYRPSKRRYQEHVRPWEYPAGSDIRRVNVNGAIAEAGRKWFVCEALAGQWVRVERFDEKLLVSYRHMYIREIDLQRGTTQALVVARREASWESTQRARRASAADSQEPNTERKAKPKV